MRSRSSLLFCFLVTCHCLASAISDDDRKTYIVYMGALPKDADYSPSSHHKRMLQSALGSISPEKSLIRSYDKSFNGFVAKLTETEKDKISRMKGVVSVFLDRKMQLHTTRSWNFIGLPETVERIKSVESDIIVGVLDTGIWPESESFRDDGFGPVPRKWKGSCPESFPCNKKLIGAKTLQIGENDPRDVQGHGTHTASIAAGDMVHGANFFGLANGTARGGVPSSRIAAYQVCDKYGCDQSSILAGFDHAISDGVDIITVSLGPSNVMAFDEDSVAIGAFHAAKKGILTTQSGGNSGSAAATVSSVAPWVFSIAAGMTDRHIISDTVLGNGKTLTGDAVNSVILKHGNYSLIYGKHATSSCEETEARNCRENCLDPKLVKGKIAICDQIGTDEAKRAGAAGSITKAEMPNISLVKALPFSALEPQDYDEVTSYYHSSTSPLGNILKTESVKFSAAPIVAGFSSRGPNMEAKDILKPDITAPGVEILAAFSPKASPSFSAEDHRSTNFSILSGTSMSCPHVAGASAYVKSFHPTWSPSAIKSAIMTTGAYEIDFNKALPMSPTKDPDVEFAYGSRFLNPSKAVDPGLVYETEEDDYIGFLCKLGYDASAIGQIVGHDVHCPNTTADNTSPVDVNYPSMAAKVPSNTTFNVTFLRRVTNVGRANSTYKAMAESRANLRMKVEPKVLSFKLVNEKKWFKVTAVGSTGNMLTASLTWFDGTHSVRSPIVMYAAE